MPKEKVHDSLKIFGPKACSKPMYHASLNRDPEFVPNGQEGACRPSALKRTVLRAQFLSLFFWLIKEGKTRPFKRDFAIAEDTSLTLYAVIWYLIMEAFQRTV